MMLVTGACVQIESDHDSDDLAVALQSLTSGGPFTVSAVDRVGTARHRCRFDLSRPDLVVGYRSVIELQHRIDQQFDILSVDHDAAGPAATMGGRS